MAGVKGRRKLRPRKADVADEIPGRFHLRGIEAKSVVIDTLLNRLGKGLRFRAAQGCRI